MQLVVVRHGIAVEREEWAREHGDDDARPLTADGKKKMKECAKGLHALVPRLDQLATSPLVRAVQTAQIVAKRYDLGAPLILPELAPGQRPDALTAWLQAQSGRKTVAVVGHEPALSTTVSWLVGRMERPMLELGKGGACLLDFVGRVEAGAAMLLWLLRPSQLR